MGKRKKHPEEFKRDAVRLMRARGTRGSNTVKDVARTLGINENLLYAWDKKLGREMTQPSPEEPSRDEKRGAASPRARAGKGQRHLTKSRGLFREGKPVSGFKFIHTEKAHSRSAGCHPCSACRVADIIAGQPVNAANESGRTRCIEFYYNDRRLHSTLDYVSPLEYEMHAA